MSTTDTIRAAFESAYLSANGFHTKAELANEWKDGMLSSHMFRAGYQAATEAAKATGTAGELPPEWISEVCGPDVDGLSYGQGYRRGFNDCRKKVSELQAKLITDEEAWEIIKDEARMQVIDEHGSMAIVIKSPSEAWFIARAILAANNRPSMITAEDCPICKGQSGGIGADGVENDCHECFRREVQAARQPAPVVAVKPWEARMQEYFAQGSVKMRTPASFMADEISDWRAALAATAAPVTQPHYRMSEKPTAWLHTLPEGKFFNGSFSDNSQIIRDKDEADSECYFHGGTLTPLFTAEWTQASLDYVNEKADELHKKIVGSQP